MGQTCECNGEPQDADNTQNLISREEEDEIDIEDYIDEEDKKMKDDGEDVVEIPPVIEKDDPAEELKQPEDDGAGAGAGAETEAQDAPFDMLKEISDSPTLEGSRNFWQSKDCTWINNTITKMRKDEIKKGLVNLLCSRSMTQRVLIREFYQEKFSTDLLEEVANAVKKGKTQTLLQHLLHTPAELMANQITQAMKDQSTRDLALIIVVLTNRQIKDLQEAYAAQDGQNRSLNDDVLEFCKDDHMKVLLENLLRCEEMRVEIPESEVVEATAIEDAERIKTALEVARVSEIDVQSIVEILSTSAWHHIAMIEEKYNTVSSEFPSLLEAMEKRGFANLDVGVACHALVRMATDRHGYFAQQISETDSPWRGVDHEKVARVIIYRCEIDLGEIMRTFSESDGYGSNLPFQSWLERKISGTYQYSLSLLCGLAVPDTADDDIPEPGAAGLSPSASGDDGSVPRMNEICNYSDFSSFCSKKIGEKARMSLWKKVDKNEDGFVDAQEVRDLLIYTAVVYYTHKLKKEHGIKELDDNMRKEAPAFIEPISNWILENKLLDGSLQLTRENFVENEVAWIQEYADLAEAP